MAASGPKKITLNSLVTTLQKKETLAKFLADNRIARTLSIDNILLYDPDPNRKMLIATILEGIIGALLVVPFIASLTVIAGYLRRRILGLPPFEDDGSQQFVAPPEKINPPRKKKRKNLTKIRNRK